MKQESNTFCLQKTGIDDFKCYYYLLGEELNRLLQTENEVKGFARAAQERGAILHPTMYAGAVSSGRVTREALDELKRTLMAQLDGLPPCDGMLFAMHGAWTAEDEDDADGEILTAIRDKLGGSIPLVVTFDSHANVTRHMVEQVDGLVGFRTFPHIDFAETGYRAARLLFSIIDRGITPSIGFAKVPMITPAENQQTYRGPMHELWQEALAVEQRDPALVVSLFAVQPWLDVSEMGFSAVVVGDNPAATEQEARRLGEIMWRKRKEFDVQLYSVTEILKLMEQRRSGTDSPIVVSDSADSPGAGSPGDSNYVLRQLLQYGAEQRFDCLLCMVDASASAIAANTPVGSRIALTVGHTLSPDMGEPLDIEGVVTVAKLSGKFRFVGGSAANMEANMGCCAVIAIGKISLLLMEYPTLTGDPAMYRSVGLEPMKADLVLVKSANQFRAEFERLTERIYILDTPGASTANLLGLPFVNVPRPMYPFDDNFR
jgi:microcystin degradation protein MlrC